MKKFIGENLRYPGEALENKVEGTVYVKYDIDYQGNVTDAKVMSSLGHGCDEEAVRLVKLLKYKVDNPRGLRVLYHKNIQIHFRLPVVQQQPVQQQVQYHFTTTPKKEKEEVPKPAGSYTVTIPLK